MSSKVENKLAILSYHEKRIQLEHEVQQRYENLSEEAQAVIRDVIREFINRSAMPVRIIYAQKFVEELENTLFEKNQAFKKLSDIHARALTEHNDQLDYTWKDGYETGVRDTNAVCKPKIEEQKAQLLDQAKRHQKRVDELKAQVPIIPDYVTGFFDETVHTGLIVQNWHTAWKWLSTWAFAAIGYVSLYGIPPEVLALVPEASQSKVTAALALLGFVGRFINQSKPKPLPPASDEIKEHT